MAVLASVAPVSSFCALALSTSFPFVLSHAWCCLYPFLFLTLFALALSHALAASILRAFSLFRCCVRSRPRCLPFAASPASNRKPLNEGCAL
eukprot:4384291-Pleurochrysis_carterae.AAC.2